MKKVKYVILLFVLVFIVVLRVSQPDEMIEVQTIRTTGGESIESVAKTPELTKQMILDLFNGYAYADPDNKRAVDCVVVTDDAFGLMGIVQYTTDDYDGCWFDYLGQDGNLKGVVGIPSVTSVAGTLKYQENGTIACRFVDDNESNCLYTIHYTNDGNGNIDFNVETQ